MQLQLIQTSDWADTDDESIGRVHWLCGTDDGHSYSINHTRTVPATASGSGNGSDRRQATTATATAWRGREKERGKKPITCAAAPPFLGSNAWTFADAGNQQEKKEGKERGKKGMEKGVRVSVRRSVRCESVVVGSWSAAW